MDTDGKESEIYRRWDDGFLVRRMRREERRQVIKWFESIGNGAVSVDLEVAFDMDRDNDGFCVGELNGEMIASVVVTQIAEDLKYPGYLFIVEQYRKRGFANRMIAVAHDIIDRCNWVGIVGFDSMDYAQSMYEKVGYKSAYKTTIYRGTVPADVDQDTFGTDIRLVKKLLTWACYRYCVN